jgi:hypothetical protein
MKMLREEKVDRRTDVLNRNEGVVYFKVLTCTNVIKIEMVNTYIKLDVDGNVEYCDMEWNNCGGSNALLLLLLLSLLLYYYLSLLCRVFTVKSLKQTMLVRYIIIILLLWLLLF